MPLSHPRGQHFSSFDYFSNFDKSAMRPADAWVVVLLSGVANGLVRGAIRDGAYLLFQWRLDAMTAVSSLWVSYAIFTGISCFLIFLSVTE